MTNVKKQIKERDIIGDKELADLEKKATSITDVYTRLRALSLLAIFSLTGKRVSEVSILKMSDVTVYPNRVVFKFTLSKKRRKEKQPDGSVKSIKKYETVKKTISKTNPLTQHVINYYDFMKKNHAKSLYLFPSGLTFFGDTRIFYDQEHISRSQIWRIIKQLSPKIWLHLFRETVGGRIAEEDGMTINAIYKIKNRLNLVREDTAFRYVKRYAEDVIE